MSGEHDDDNNADVVRRDKRHRWWSPKARMLCIVTLVVCMVAIGGTMALLSSRQAIGLPSEVVREITAFQPYYLDPNLQSHYTLSLDTVHYQDGILLFTLKDAKGKLLAVTEERTPPGYDPSSLRTDKSFTSTYGRGLIVDNPSGTQGSLFSDDGTWVLINAPSPIGSGPMQQLLNALAPAGQP